MEKVPTPSTIGSVTRWIEELQGGSSSPVPEVWQRYFGELAKTAQERMASSRQRAMDGEDVASIVLETFCRNVAIGRYPNVRDRRDLWNLLMTIAQRKIISQFRREQRRKHGQGQVNLASDIQSADEEPFDVNKIADTQPTLESIVILEDSVNFLIDELLPEEAMKKIARWKLEGHSNGEIAELLNVVPETVQRKLRLIRKRWAKELGIDLGGSEQDGQDSAG